MWRSKAPTANGSSRRPSGRRRATAQAAPTRSRRAATARERTAREVGESRYGLSRMVLFAWDAVVSFSSFPPRIAGMLGAAVAGWTSVTAAVLVLGGAQLVFLGILGQYVGRMYDDLRRRPLFLIREDTESGPG